MRIKHAVWPRFFLALKQRLEAPSVHVGTFGRVYSAKLQQGREQIDMGCNAIHRLSYGKMILPADEKLGASPAFVDTSFNFSETTSEALSDRATD